MINKIKPLTFFFVCCWAYSTAQITISGVVLDASSHQPLPFANILTENGDGGITNENGKFIMEMETMPDRLQASYMGYEMKEVLLQEGTFFYPIKISPISLELMEVQVMANDENAASFFYTAIEKSRKASISTRHAKLFRRTYSTIGEGTPTELLEGYYNAAIEEGGVRSFDIKNGRIGVPINNYLLQFDLCKVLEGYNFYGDNRGYFPSTPLQEKSAKRILKDYYVRYAGSFVSSADTIVKITFESKKPGSAFDGAAFINKSNLQIVRVVHDVKKADHIPFQPVRNRKGTSLENMGLKWDTGFEIINGSPVPKYMHLILNMDFVYGTERAALKSNTKLFFYDYQNLFTLPVFDDTEELNDYDKIMAVPYNQEFWRRATVLPETGMEERFRKDLENSQLFVNDRPSDEHIDLLNNKFQLIQSGTTPAWEKVPDSKLATYDSQTRSTLGTDPYNGLFAKTLLFLDYNCFEDSTQFKVSAILDYSRSYMVSKNELEGAFFMKYLQFSNQHASKFEEALTEKYHDKCPTREDLLLDLKNAEKAMKKEFFALFNGQKKRDDDYLARLETMLNQNSLR